MKAARLLLLVTAAGALLFPTPAQAAGKLRISFTPGSVELSTGGTAAEATVNITAPEGKGTYELAVETDLRRVDDEVAYEVLPGPGCEPDGVTGLDCRLEGGATVIFIVRFTVESGADLGAGDRVNGRLELVAEAEDGDREIKEKAALAVGLVGGEATEMNVPSVTGTVSDDAGRPISGAEITVIDHEGGKFTGRTDDQGAFQVEPGAGETMAPGELTVRATAPDGGTTTLIVTGDGGRPAVVALAVAAPKIAPDTPADESTAALLWPWLLMAAAMLVVAAMLAVVLRRRPAGESPALAGYTDPPTLTYDRADEEELARYGAGGRPSVSASAYGNEEAPTKEFDPRMPPRETP